MRQFLLTIALFFTFVTPSLGQAPPPPTVATPASATPSPATGTSTSLSVLGADVSGELTLSYTWAAINDPPAAVTFSANGTNAAKNTVATFSDAGSYTLQATITDEQDQSTTSVVTVTVNQTLTSIAVTPGPTLTINPPLPVTQQFTANALDQFGNALATQPAIAWSLAAGGVGSVSSTSGLYHSGTIAGTATVKAKSGTVLGTCLVTVNAPVPSAPTNLTATGGIAQVFLAWAAAAGASSYNVYRGTATGAESVTAICTDVTTTSCADTGLATGTTYYYKVEAFNGAPSLPSNEATARTAPLPPSVATAASATPNPVTGKTAALSVLGSDSSGESTLEYTWAGISSPPAPVTFSANGTNAAKNSTATFTQAGSYTVQATITDAFGQSTTSTVAVTVSQTVTSIAVTPGPTLTINPPLPRAQQFTATAYDQFGDVLTTQPAMLWTEVAGGVGSVSSSSGLYHSGTVAGTATVKAKDGSIAGTCLVTVNSSTPTSPPAPTGLTATGGVEQVTLAWTASTGASSYSIYRGTAADEESATAIATGVISLSYADTGLAPSSTYYYKAAAYNGVLSPSSNEAGATTDPPPPGIATAAYATPNPVTGDATSLSALGSDASGESTLTYSWAAINAPPAPVTFSANNTNASQNTTATFSQAGSYALQATITDAYGQSVTSTVTVTVNQTLTSLILTPGPTLTINPPLPKAQQFTTTALDQFGDALATQPAISWSLAAGSVGSVSSSTGLFHSGTVAGTATVKAKSGALSATCVVTVNPPAPAAPTGLTATGANAQVALAWTASTSATSYAVYRATTSGGEGVSAIVSGIATTSYTDTTVTNGVTYFYQVSASNIGGTSVLSNEDSATPLPPIPPAPSGLTATGGSAQVALAWTASGGATSYAVYRATMSGGEGATPIASGIASPAYTDTTVSNGVTYFYKLSAVNAGGTSGLSNEASAEPIGAFGGTPAAIPGTVQAENYDIGGQNVGYYVTSVNGTGNSYRSDGVDLEACSDTGGGYDVGWSSTGQWFRYTVNVASAGQYSVALRVASDTSGGTLHLQNSAGTSLTGPVTVPGTGGWQTWNTVYALATLPAGQQIITLYQDTGGYNFNSMTISVATPPAAPAGLAAVAGNGQNTLMWTPSNGATSYSVYRGTSSNGEQATPVATGITAPNFTDTSLTNGVGYYYEVTAISIVGPSPDSNEATATPEASIPYFGPNVLLFNPSILASTVQAQTDYVYSLQQNNQFGSNRYALMFSPGAYNATVHVGFYTQVLGLGSSPNDVTITGAVQSNAYLANGNATQNFWRGAENLAIVPTGGTDVWAVSQACPMRRVHIEGGIILCDSGSQNWSSGGFLSDSLIDDTINSGSQQQWISRNNQWGSWVGGSWNMVFVGDDNPPSGTFPAPPYTTVTQTPVSREKPFLTVDGSGNYSVFVPAVATNSQGTTWAGGTEIGQSIPLSQFYIARAGVDTAATINSALSSGLNLLLTPGVYQLGGTIHVNNPNTVVLGLGIATLEAQNGAAAMQVADVAGVVVAGILFDAGSTSSPYLLQVGPAGSSANNSTNPISLQDIFFRVGGAGVGQAAESLEINSNYVIGDDFWIWRADHGNGVGWSTNVAANGLVVNGASDTIYGLAVEHYQKYQTLWNGNGGQVYFYQSEAPYDVPSDSSWMDGSIDGFASYKVANTVTSHQAYGLGVYCAFNNKSVNLQNAIEAPDLAAVNFTDMVTVSLGGAGTINSIINGTGPTANSSSTNATLDNYP